MVWQRGFASNPSPLVKTYSHSCSVALNPPLSTAFLLLPQNHIPESYTAFTVDKHSKTLSNSQHAALSISVSVASYCLLVQFLSYFDISAQSSQLHFFVLKGVETWCRVNYIFHYRSLSVQGVFVEQQMSCRHGSQTRSACRSLPNITEQRCDWLNSKAQSSNG